MADDQMNAGRARRSDHGCAVVKRQRDRLLDQHMLAVARGEPRVFGVILMRRCNIDGLDMRDRRRVRRPSRRPCRRSRSAKRWRASGRGSAAATSATRGSRCNVGSIMEKARPRPATPSRNRGGCRMTPRNFSGSTAEPPFVRLNLDI